MEPARQEANQILTGKAIQELNQALCAELVPETLEIHFASSSDLRRTRTWAELRYFTRQWISPCGRVFQGPTCRYFNEWNNWFIIIEFMMFKKKSKKPEKAYQETSPMMRVETEADVMPHKQGKTRAQINERFQVNTYSQPLTSKKLKLKCKELQKIFMTLKDILEEQLDNLIIGQPIWQIYEIMMQSQLFRVCPRTKNQMIQELGKIIQALQLLYSKLVNNQKVKDVLYVKDESQLLLFFKHLFGKPYTVCNLPSFRKVLNTIWQHQIFESFDPKKMADHLRHWCCGIQYPLNPAVIPLHRLVFNNSSMIKKYALLLCNMVTYCNIDSGDCMGLTPLLVAVHSNKVDAYENIIKSGSSLFRCPLSTKKNKKTISLSKRANKDFIQITYPLTERKQYNPLEVLLHHRQFQQIVNVLSMNEVYKLKKLKKNNTVIGNFLKEIPECYLQIHWKTSKGFLSFKQLPKDIVSIYKKGGSLRIDYHVDDIQQTSSQPKNYSILIRTNTEESAIPKLQYYLINHSSKKIQNFMKQIHPQKLKLRYEQLTKVGNIEEQYITSIKSVTKMGQVPQLMEVNAEYCYENVSKAPVYQFKDISTYERALFESDVIDYAILQDSQFKCTDKQVVGQMQKKVKSKLIKSSSKFNIEWSKEKINLRHIFYIMSLLDKKSPLFLKLNKLFEVFLNQECFSSKYQNKLPIKMTVDLGQDFNLQAEIKNLTYMTLDDAVFGLEFRTKTMAYEEENVGMESLQETMIMEQSYSINMSRFLGTTEQLLDKEEEEANKKFEELLSRQIAGRDFSDEEDSSSLNEKKQEMIMNMASERSTRTKGND